MEYALGTCTDECITELVKYADECLGSEAAAEAYKTALEEACDDDDGSGDDATTVAATLFSTLTALLVAMDAALN